MFRHRWAVWILVFVLLVVTACGAAPTATPVPPTATPIPPPHAANGLPVTFKDFVDVGGYELELWCWGNGSPTVVLETALGTPFVYYIDVQAKAPASLRFCMYNRAGLGTSDPPPSTPRTVADMTSELHALLAKANIAPPYILMGHSEGGLIARLYASQYPREVAGVLLIDSAHPEWTAALSAVIPPEKQGEDPTLKIIRTNYDPAFMANLPFEGGVDMVKSLQQAKDSGNLGSTPLVVLARSPKDVSGFPGGFPTDVILAMNKAWMALQKDLLKLSTNSTYMEAANAGHMIPADEPEAVLNALDLLIQKIKTK